VPAGGEQLGGGPDVGLPVEQLVGLLLAGEQPAPDVSLLAQRPDRGRVGCRRVDGTLR
jgi:hypothetical protein